MSREKQNIPDDNNEVRQLSPEDFEGKITEGLSDAEKAVVLAFFDSAPLLPSNIDQKIPDIIDGIEDSEARQKLTDLYTHIIGLEACALEESNSALTDLSSATGVPREFLMSALSVDKNEMSLDDTEIQKAREGSAKLEKFLKDCHQPYNLFYLDKNLSAKDLLERAQLLDSLYVSFKEMSFKDRDLAEAVLNQMFDIKTIDNDAQNYLDQREMLSRATNDNHRFSEGAENKNLIHPGQDYETEVVKISKGRHDQDFISVIKLMRDMHYLTLHFDKGNKENSDINVNVDFDDMTIYRDAQGNYKRLIRQDFAAGRSLKDMPREIVESNEEFRKAWKSFLSQVESMKEQYGLVLDITDSSVGGKGAFKSIARRSYNFIAEKIGVNTIAPDSSKSERGNVNYSGNIFVRLPSQAGEKYQFTIIDPDVFDTDPGEHKFAPDELVRKKGILALGNMLKTHLTNLSRKELVLLWQREYVKKELADPSRKE